MNIAFIDAHRDRFPVAVICRVLEFPERTFYAFKARPVCARAVADAEHKTIIRAEWTANYQCYGARRLHKHLRRQGHLITRCTVARLMRDLGIRGVQRGRKQFTTHPDKSADRPPDLVKRVFTADAPNRLWLTDITYCSTWEGWLYVAFITNVYARMIVGWQIASHMRTDLVLDALEIAAWRRDLIDGCVHHADAGSQYTSIRYTDRLADAGLTASVGTAGCTPRSATSHQPSSKVPGTVNKTSPQRQETHNPHRTKPGALHHLAGHGTDDNTQHQPNSQHR